MSAWSRNSWIDAPRRISRRFTTLEGFRELRGMYITGANVRVFSVQHQFDFDNYENDTVTSTRTRTSKAGSIEQWSVWDGTTTQSSAVESGVETRASVARPEEPYHVFSKKEIWSVVAIIGIAGLFSGLSSNIYFPALDAIAKDLKVSLSTVSLTITSYLIIQGISPLFWGSLSDTLGRRQIYIYSFLIYIIANIGLSFSPNFIVLLLFRGLQSAGSASTVSIGNGVIQDITPPAQRGGYISFYQAIRNFSIAIGPVLGGLIANFLGFRSIFIFLLIISTLTLIAIIVFLPETLRSIAGNGELRLSGIHQPLIRRFKGDPSYVVDAIEPATRPKITPRIFIEPLLLLKEKDILLSLIFGGTIYAIWSMVTASTTGLFKEKFGLNELLVGVAFLPNGLGTIVGSTIIGNLMNRSYARAEERYKEVNHLPVVYKLPKKSIPIDFPIEHVRLEYMNWIVPIFVISTTLYGFSLGYPTVTSRPGWITIPLILQFLIAATSNAVFAINQTLVSDLCPGKGASSTAINNLVRCGMGAVGVAIIEQLVAGMGPQGAFLSLSLVVLAVIPLATIQWYWGSEWRGERAAKVDLMQKEKSVQA